MILDVFDDGKGKLGMVYLNVGCKSREQNEFRNFHYEKGCKQSVHTRGGRVANKPKDGFLFSLPTR